MLLPNKLDKTCLNFVPLQHFILCKKLVKDSRIQYTSITNPCQQENVVSVSQDGQGKTYNEHIRYFKLLRTKMKN